MTREAGARVLQFPQSDAPHSGTVSVSSGANTVELDIAGTPMTVDTVRQKLTEILNIGPDHKALRNGNDVPGDQVLIPGDRVEFVREAGVKG